MLEACDTPAHTRARATQLHTVGSARSSETRLPPAEGMHASTTREPGHVLANPCVPHPPGRHRPPINSTHAPDLIGHAQKRARRNSLAFFGKFPVAIRLLDRSRPGVVCLCCK